SMPIEVTIRLHACHGGYHREAYSTGRIYGYRIFDNGKPIHVVRDKYRLSDSTSDTHVSSVSLDDAPPERLADVDHLDPRERAEERCGDHGRDRDDDARMVATVPGFRLSVAGPDDPGGAAEEAGRRPLRADAE